MRAATDSTTLRLGQGRETLVSSQFGFARPVARTEASLVRDLGLADQLDAPRARYLAMHRGDDQGRAWLARIFATTRVDRSCGEALVPAQGLSVAW